MAVGQAVLCPGERIGENCPWHRGWNATAFKPSLLRLLLVKHTFGDKSIRLEISCLGKAKAVMCCEGSHVVEGVLRIGLSVVWHDGDRADADLA